MFLHKKIGINGYSTLQSLKKIPIMHFHRMMLLHLLMSFYNVTVFHEVPSTNVFSKRFDSGSECGFFAGGDENVRKIILLQRKSNPE